MFELVHAQEGAAFFRSSLLARIGVPHAFSTRIGGVSTGPFASLNFGNPQDSGEQDSAANIQINRQLLLGAIGRTGFPVATVRQVHGNQTVVIPPEVAEQPAILARQFSGQICADAVICRTKGVLCAIRTADCVPILLADIDGQMAAAVHAGWRGVMANIIGGVIATMTTAGIPPHRIAAAVGPAIGAAAFEVSPEVAESFIQAGLSHTVITGPGRPHIDLAGSVASQLCAAGIVNIDSSNLCTAKHPDYFFSHRRDKGITGRMMAVIGRPD